jgi:multiple sugar transport system substrate-binding protein
VRVRIKYALLILLGMAMLAFMVGYRPKDVSAGGSKTVIQVWQPFGGPWYEGVQTMVGEFQRKNPETACNVAFMGNDVYRDMKFYLSAVGHCPPDVVFVPSDRVAEWAHRRLLRPMDDLLRQEGKDPVAFRQEFFEPLWKQCTYYDKTYAIAINGDPVWGMIWNKRKLREFIASGEIPAGAIDLENGPRTMDDLARFNTACMKFENNDPKNGRLLRVGSTPFLNWQYCDAIYPFGWVFGGEFYNEKTGKITANDPNVVKALEWLCAEACRCDLWKARNMSTAGGKNAFIEGNSLLDLGAPLWVTDFPRVAPDMVVGRDIGVGNMPVLHEGAQPGTSMGGWTLAIPAGVTDPAKLKAAMRFIIWVCASPDGTTWKLRGTAFMPGWKGAKQYFDVADRDPGLRVYVEIMRTAKHYRPVIPIATFLNDQISQAGSRAIEAACRAKREGKSEPDITPQQALDEANKNAQEYLVRFLKDYPPPD